MKYKLSKKYTIEEDLSDYNDNIENYEKLYNVFDESDNLHSTITEETLQKLIDACVVEELEDNHE